MTTQRRSYKVAVVYNATDERAEADDPDLISESAVKHEAEAVYHALAQKGHYPLYFPFSNIKTDLGKILELQPDIIFNLCEGYQGQASDEMFVAGLWELIHIPYSGNAPLTLGLSQNKILTKKLLEAKKISTPPFQVYSEIPRNTYLSYPLIAKPSREDGSVGITQKSFINDFYELQQVVNALLAKYKQPILVEKFIAGREFNVAILGNHPPRVLAVSEISFEQVGVGYHPITSYEAKWLEDHPLYRQTPSICPADIPDDLKHRLEESALQVYRLLRGRDYGRVDFRVNDQNQIFVLEYNPNPDISPDAGYSKALRAAGIQYGEFIEMLLEEAMNRNGKMD